MSIDRLVGEARTLLFVPGARPERFPKALASGADVVILDLEDAVAPAEKESARRAVLAWLDANRSPVPGAQAARAQALVVRINAAETRWFSDDLAVASQPGVSAIIVPKVESADALAPVREAGARSLVPLVESAAGLARLREICSAPEVARIAFGSIDFQLDLGMRGATDDELLPFRASIVLESRLAGLAPPVDGVSTAIDDAASLADDVRRARRLGFGAKLCIHPRQVARVAEGFAPDAAECAWARRVVDAAAAAAGAAVAVDGKMVDRPVLLRAQAILREAGLLPAALG